MSVLYIIVCNKIKQQQMPTLDIMCIKVVGIRIKINSRYVTFVSTYQSLSHEIHITDYEKISFLKSTFIMAGDLKPKHTNWNCRFTNPIDNKLQTCIANTLNIMSASSGLAYFPFGVNRLYGI